MRTAALRASSWVSSLLPAAGALLLLDRAVRALSQKAPELLSRQSSPEPGRLLLALRRSLAAQKSSADGELRGSSCSQPEEKEEEEALAE